MTQTVTKTPQSKVREFVEKTIKTPDDFKKPLNLRDLGISETLTFQDIRTLTIRGLTLKVQSHERPSSTKKLSERIKELELELQNRS